MIESLTKIQMLAPVQYLPLVFTSGFKKQRKNFLSLQTRANSCTPACDFELTETC